MFPTRYEVIEGPLNGGMGSVYKCKDVTLARFVAIKVLQNVADERRMADEIDALLKLRSKHVVQVYDLVPVEAGRAVVQEFIEGNDLWRRDGHPVSVAQKYRCLWQIASGIADIHDAGVIHRDIKPNNMKIDPEGVIKIFDFGLARNNGVNASTLGFIGTYGFAAPELFDGRVAFTPAVDTYAFGATAIHLIAGQLPEDMRRPMPPQALPVGFFERLNSGLSGDVVRLLEACMHMDPSRRPLMASVRDELAKHLLFDKHQALAVHKGHPYYLNKDNRTVSARWDGVGSVRITYDGMKFFVEEVEGEVFINYMPATANQLLPESCVLALGASTRGNMRMYITFDLSRPEVVL
ncbi:serine/threonine protein kinase [Pseudoxanthomonas helianthi]|uniref:Serine/threonine protein kinase n=1 Tax=Pseudoxanthomonas helianthi TaxID=1453541 RepID=A0A940X291_9GAMM|nr:serine/threonine-protein kinase [Pseudoxanthomonas helianthi]MBP3983767.1 serine/threonine protein kinase [Pseudoxanthomonas helianthi]